MVGALLLWMYYSLGVDGSRAQIDGVILLCLD